FGASLKISTRRSAIILSSPSLSCQTAKPKLFGSPDRPPPWCPFAAEPPSGAFGSRPRMPLDPAPMLPIPTGRVSASFCMTSGPADAVPRRPHLPSPPGEPPFLAGKDAGRWWAARVLPATERGHVEADRAVLPKPFLRRHIG